MNELGEIEKKADAIGARLDREIRRKKNSMIISLVGGAVLLVIVFLYFGFIKGLVREVIEPRGMALMARDQVEKMLPDAARELERALKEQAPYAAKYVHEQILIAIPQMREYLEVQFVTKTEESLEALVGEFDNLVSDALTENRAVITGFMRDVQDPAKKEELTKQIYESIKAQFSDPQIKADLDSYTNVLIRLNKKIKFLYEGRDLSEEETLVRDIIMAVRELASRGATKKI